MTCKSKFRTSQNGGRGWGTQETRREVHFFRTRNLLGRHVRWVGQGGGGGNYPIAKSFRHRYVPKLVGVFSCLFLCLLVDCVWQLPWALPRYGSRVCRWKGQKTSPTNWLPGSSSAAICFLPTTPPPPRPPRLLRVPDPYLLFSDRQHRRHFHVSGARLPCPTTRIRNSWELIRTWHHVHHKWAQVPLFYNQPNSFIKNNNLFLANIQLKITVVKTILKKKKPHFFLFLIYYLRKWTEV
jgi:hypothetical protein